MPQEDCSQAQVRMKSFLLSHSFLLVTSLHLYLLVWISQPVCHEAISYNSTALEQHFCISLPLPINFFCFCSWHSWNLFLPLFPLLYHLHGMQLHCKIYVEFCAHMANKLCWRILLTTSFEHDLGIFLAEWLVIVSTGIALCTAILLKRRTKCPILTITRTWVLSMSKLQ